MTVAGGAEGSGPLIPEGLNVLRDDLGVRVMVVNTECEATSCYGVRQPDSDHYRYWEIAGASHVTLQGIVLVGAPDGARLRLLSADRRRHAAGQPGLAGARRRCRPPPPPGLDDRGRGAAGPAAHCASGATRPPSRATATASPAGGSGCPRWRCRWRTTAPSRGAPTSSPGWSGGASPSPSKTSARATAAGTATSTRYRAAVDAAVAASVVLPRDVEATDATRAGASCPL